MVTGGPRVITLGWIIVGFFALLVGMAMGEICSAYPTAGGLYYWSAKLARKNGAAVGVVHRMVQPARPDRRDRQSVDYALVDLHRLLHPHVRRRLQAHRARRSSSSSCSCSSPMACSTRSASSVVKILGDISVWWHVVGVVIIFLRPDDRSRQHARHRCGRSTQAPPGLTGWTGGAFVAVYMFGLGSAAGPVHDHRLRRLGARQRRDRRRSHRGTEGDRASDLRVGDRRILLELGDDAGDAQGRSRRLRRDRVRRRQRPVPGQRRAAADLQRGRLGDGQVPDLHRDRRPVLLRHGVGHRQQPHDLRVQPRRRVARLEVLAQDQPEDAHANELDLARRRALGDRRCDRRCTSGARCRAVLDGVLRA